METSVSLPQVILLNGTSCAGKTTASDYLLRNLGAEFQAVTWDSFLETLPRDATVGEEQRKGLVQLFIDYARTRLDGGEKLILDVVCVPVPTYQRLRDEFNDYGLASVRLKADPAVLSQREAQRPDRKQGQVAAQHEQMYIQNPHPASFYDFELDTTHIGPEETGREILEYLGLR